MQATVLDFDPDHGSGHVILDDGTTLAFGSDTFAASRLRLLRPGQRVRITADGEAVSSIMISTLPDPL